MTPALKASSRYWLAGLALAATGVSVNRLLAPLFELRPRAAAAVTGELIALAGLGVIMIGISRRVQRANAAQAAPPIASRPLDPQNTLPSS